MKTMQLIYLLVALVLLLTPQHAAAETDETSHLKGQAKTIADTVIAAQRAGWKDHDYKQYMTQWADNATLTWGRSDQPGHYDQTIDRDTIHATRKIRMRGTPPNDRYDYDEVKVTVHGDTAVLTLQVTITSEDGERINITGERYELVKTNAGWKVMHNRAWPISMKARNGMSAYTAKRWAALDKAVERGKAAFNDRFHSYALMDAYRFDEAYAVAVKVTEQPDASAEDWSVRGLFAAIAGQPEDVDPSLTKARSIDPEVWLPSFAPEKDAE